MSARLGTDSEIPTEGCCAGTHMSFFCCVRPVPARAGARLGAGECAAGSWQRMQTQLRKMSHFGKDFLQGKSALCSI